MKDYKVGEWVASGNAVHQMHSKHYGECVCICYGVNREVNGRLFAAAKDLLEVCEKAMEFSDFDYVPNSLFERMGAAVAKAKGESA